MNEANNLKKYYLFDFRDYKGSVKFKPVAQFSTKKELRVYLQSMLLRELGDGQVSHFKRNVIVIHGLKIKYDIVFNSERWLNLERDDLQDIIFNG